jgi:hypothetical protein
VARSSDAIRHWNNRSSTNNKPITLINVFTVDPAKQEQFLDLLARATESSVRHAPGFVCIILPLASHQGREHGEVECAGKRTAQSKRGSHSLGPRLPLVSRRRGSVRISKRSLGKP